MVVLNHLCLGQTLVPNAFIDRYLAAAGGDAVKVYIMLLRQSESGGSTPSALADTLELTEKAVLRALDYWQQQGLIELERVNGEITRITLISPTPESQGEKVPAGRSRRAPEAAQKAKGTSGAKTPAAVRVDVTDERFRQLIYVAEQFLGRTVTQTDTNFIIWLLEDMGFSEELTEYLFEYCVDKGHRKVSYMRAVAVGWKNAGVKDVETARAQAASFDENVKKASKTSGNKFHNFNQRDTDLDALLLQELRSDGK